MPLSVMKPDSRLTLGNDNLRGADVYSMNNQGRKKLSWTAGWTILLAAGLVLWIVLFLSGADNARAWRSLLINFLFFTPLAAGLVTWSAVITASKGRWAGSAERLAWTGVGFFVPSFIMFFALWAASPSWAPWYGKTLPQGFWFDNTFLFVRDLAALTGFWGVAGWYLRRRQKGRQDAIFPGAILIVVFCVVFTLLSFDLVLGTNAEWHSAIFGAYFFISSLYTAIVFLALLVVFDPRSRVEVRHDLGKLILAFSILTTYMLFMQLLTIWYSNLLDETFFLTRRMHEPGWMVVSSALVGVVYLGPLILLLTEWAKKNRYYLGAVAVVLLTGLWFERWWLIAPGVSRDLQFGWMEASGAAAVLGAMGLSVNLSMRKLPRVSQDGADDGQA